MGGIGEAGRSETLLNVRFRVGDKGWVIRAGDVEIGGRAT